jgi:asparagine synthase (glutamine-hydrolysing)
MCGIAGYFGPYQPAALNGVSRMLDDMLRHGPDSGGVHTSEWAILGHRRLAVLDRTPAGKQPMTLEHGTAITFNGAIYNFRELRSELERDGHRFRSSSDTEVLLRGYRSWGINDLVHRLRGMFAFAVWDEPGRRGFLVRDRLGVKPLCYAVHGQSLMFASTTEALRLAGASGDMDMSAVADFLAHGYIGEEHSHP